jgi:hypothetical protein
MDRFLSRRGFLTTSALVGTGVGALLASARSAAAFKQQPMDAETHALYLSACGGADIKAYHARLLTEAKTKLAGTMSEPEIEAAIAQLTCPICGCPLTG